jgi:hypothetical protein
MKTLTALALAALLFSCGKRDCNGHYMNFDNTTFKVMWVMSGNDVLATIPPAGTEVVKFAKCDTTYRIVFISHGYREKVHQVYVPCCDTTYYHANVQ